MEELKERVWEWMKAAQGRRFKTARGLEYTYVIRGNEIFFSRKEKSITRATVNKGIDTLLKLQMEGKEIKGPKMLGCFGASYLYPLFIEYELIKKRSDRKA